MKVCINCLMRRVASCFHMCFQWEQVWAGKIRHFVKWRKSWLHVLSICRRCVYRKWDLKSGMQRNFICASIKILLIWISSLLTKILSHKDSWYEKPRVHPKTHYYENFLYRISIPLYINLMVSTYIPFYAKKLKC